MFEKISFTILYAGLFLSALDFEAEQLERSKDKIIDNVVNPLQLKFNWKN